MNAESFKNVINKGMNRVLIVSVLLLSVGCQNEKSAYQLADSDIKEITLESSFNVDVRTIKSADPLKSIDGCYSFNGHLFLLSVDKRTIYYVEKDSVVSKLDKAGRGSGEYLNVNVFAYSEEDSIMYVSHGDEILKYQGLSNNYVGKIRVDAKISSLNVVNRNTLMATCYLEDKRNFDEYGIFLLSTETGQITKEVIGLDYDSYYFSQARDFYQSNNSIVFPVGGDINKVYRFSEDRLEEITSFQYEKKYRIPKKYKVKDTEDIKQLMKYTDFVLNGDYCVGGYYPLVKNDAVLVWSFPFDNGEPFRRILSKLSNGKVNRYSELQITGTTIILSPYIVWEDKYLFMLQSTSDAILDKENELSALGKKIVDSLNSNEGNPILILFDLQ